MPLAAAIAIGAGFFAILGFFLALIFGDRLIILWGLREIRKQAETAAKAAVDAARAEIAALKSAMEKLTSELAQMKASAEAAGKK